MNVLVLLQPSWRTTRAQFSRVEREPRSGDWLVVRAQSHEHIFWQPFTKSSKTCVNVQIDFKTKWCRVPRSPGYATHTIQNPTIYKGMKTGLGASAGSPSTYLWRENYRLKLSKISQWNYTQDTYCVKRDSFSTLLTNQDISVTLSSLRDKVLQWPLLWSQLWREEHQYLLARNRSLLFLPLAVYKMSTNSQNEEKGKTVLIPVDGSERSERAFQCKCDLISITVIKPIFHNWSKRSKTTDWASAKNRNLPLFSGHLKPKF